MYVNANESPKNGKAPKYAQEDDEDDNVDDDGNETSDESEQLYSNTAAATITNTDMNVADLRSRVKEKQQKETFKQEFSVSWTCIFCIL